MGELECGMGKAGRGNILSTWDPCKELITFEATIVSRADIPNIMLDP